MSNYYVGAVTGKNISILLFSVFFVLLLVGTVSAFEFDNIKNFESSGNYGKITIKNMFGWGSDLAEIELYCISIPIFCKQD